MRIVTSILGIASLTSALILLLLSGIPAQAEPGIGTADGFSISIVKITNHPDNQPDSLQIDSPVGSQVQVNILVKYGSAITNVSGVTLFYNEIGAVLPSNLHQIPSPSGPALTGTPLPDTGSGDAVVHAMVFTTTVDTLPLFNNVNNQKNYQFFATTDYLWHGFSMSGTSDIVSTEMRNLIIKLETVNPTVIFVNNPFTPQHISFCVDDAVLSPTTFVIKIYPTNRADNTGTPIRTCNETISNFSLPYNYNIDWDGKDDNGQYVTAGSYVYRIEVHQSDGDTDASTSDYLSICNTDIGIAEDECRIPIEYISSYILLNSSACNSIGSTQANVTVYSNDGSVLANTIAGEYKCWSSTNIPVNGDCDYARIPLFDPNNVIGYVIYLINAQDMGVDEKAHRKKWALPKNIRKGFSFNSVGYLNQIMSDKGARDIKGFLSKINIGSYKTDKKNPKVRIYDFIYSIGTPIMPPSRTMGDNPIPNIHEYDVINLLRTLGTYDIASYYTDLNKADHRIKLGSPLQYLDPDGDANGSAGYNAYENILILTVHGMPGAIGDNSHFNFDGWAVVTDEVDLKKKYLRNFSELGKTNTVLDKIGLAIINACKSGKKKKDLSVISKLCELGVGKAIGNAYDTPSGVGELTTKVLAFLRAKCDMGVPLNILHAENYVIVKYVNRQLGISTELDDDDDGVYFNFKSNCIDSKKDWLVYVTKEDTTHPKEEFLTDNQLILQDPGIGNLLSSM